MIYIGPKALSKTKNAGVLIVLGLGTALRLALECCHEWGSRRNIQHPEMNINLGYPPAV